MCRELKKILFEHPFFINQYFLNKSVMSAQTGLNQFKLGFFSTTNFWLS